MQKTQIANREEIIAQYETGIEKNLCQISVLNRCIEEEKQKYSVQEKNL